MSLLELVDNSRTDKNTWHAYLELYERLLHKKIVFRTRDANSSINIMKLTSCWIENQERPLCFQISSFTSSSKNKEDEKVRPS